jgi:hypothetical protein
MKRPTLEQEFEDYERSVYDTVITEDQRTEIKRAFFAGARVATSQIGNTVRDKKELARTVLSLDTQLHLFMLQQK